MINLINDAIQKFAPILNDSKNTLFIPYIAQNKLMKVISLYANYETAQQILFLHDDTLFHSCKASIIATVTGVHGKSKGMPPFHFYYNEIKAIDSKLTALFINDKLVFNFKRLEFQKVAILKDFIQTVKEISIANNTQPTTLPVYDLDPIYTNIKKTKKQEIVKQNEQANTISLLPQISDKLYSIPNLFVSPNIPADYLQNVIARFYPSCNPADVSLFYYNNIDGYNEFCVLCTNTGLFMHSPNKPTTFYQRNQLQSFTINNNSAIVINHDYSLDLPGITTLDAGKILAYFSVFYGIGNASAMVSLILSQNAASDPMQLITTIQNIWNTYDQVSTAIKDVTDSDKQQEDTSEVDEEEDQHEVEEEEEEEEEEEDDDDDDDDDIFSLFDD